MLHSTGLVISVFLLTTFSIVNFWWLSIFLNLQNTFTHFSEDIFYREL